MQDELEWLGSLLRNANNVAGYVESPVALEDQVRVSDWESRNGVVLPADFTEASLRYGGSSFGEGERRYISRNRRGEPALGRRQVETLLDVLGRNEQGYGSLDRARAQVPEQLQFFYSEQGVDIRRWADELIPVAGYGPRGLFAFDVSFNRTAPPIVYIDVQDDWAIDEAPFVGICFVAPSFTEFVRGIEFPDNDTHQFASLVLSAEDLTDDYLQWSEHCNRMIGVA